MPFEQIPYTNFHGTNQDWMIQQIKQMIADWASYRANLDAAWAAYQSNLTGEWTDYQENINSWRQALDASFNELHTYVHDYFDNLDVQEEINNKLDQMAEDGTLDRLLLPYFNEYKQQINTTVSNQNSRITIVQNEVNNFLENTGTLGTEKDPELIDIRVAADGTTYPTAGDSVRQQFISIGKLKKGITTYKLLPDKYYNYNGNLIASAGWSATEIINCQDVTALYINASEKSTYNMWFDDPAGGSDHLIGSFTVEVGDNIIPIRNGASYFALSGNTEGMDDLYIYALPTYDQYYNLKKRVDDIETVNTQQADQIDDLNDKIDNTIAGIKKLPLINNKYYNYNGNLVNYNDWSATNVISCQDATALYINASAKSTYNMWFDDPAGGSDHLIGSFTVNIGDNVIPVREGASYFALSGTTESMEDLLIYVLPTYEQYYNLKKRVDDIEQTTGDTSIISLNPKNTVGNNIVQSHRKANPWDVTPRPTVPDVMTFGVITDLHGSQTELSRFIQFCNKYNDYINGGLLSLGDMVTNVYSNDFTYWLNTAGADDIMLTIGNHDTWLTNSASSELAPKVDVYNKYFAPNVSNWNVQQPANAAANGLMYYYKDYIDSALRIIVLDCMYWTAEENTWFTNVLNDALTNNFDVLAIQHYNPSKNLTAMNGNFNSLDYGFSHLVQSSGASQMLAAVESFITNGGKFVGWLSGDSHYDAFGVYTNNDINQASFTFEAGGHAAGWADAERVVGEKSQDSFNIVSVDTYSKLIKIVRVGNNADRFLRAKNCLTYNYNTGTVITTN